jgi:hypothetical protein
MAMRAFFHFEKSKNQLQLIRHFIHDTTLVRLNLAPRESQNFRPLRKAMNVAHFGFPPSAGPESGQATAPFK